MKIHRTIIHSPTSATATLMAFTVDSKTYDELERKYRT